MAKETAIAVTPPKPESLVQRLVSWFTPGLPQPPSSQTSPPRAFDYQSQINQIWIPRKNEVIGFRYLRAFADTSYLIRVILEGVKNRIATKPWHLKLKAKPGEFKAATIERSVNDARVQQLTAFFNCPDGEHTWSEWLRMWLEDMLVIDAASLSVERSFGGQIMSLRVIDGASINRVIDSRGMTPAAPPKPIPAHIAPPLEYVAYQQVIKGMPMLNLTRHDLVYMPRNVRANKLFGFSPIEQTFILAQTALMRSIWQKNYYDESNIPLGFIQLPKDIGVDEMVRFTEQFNAKLQGDLNERSRLYPLPENCEIKLLKQEDQHQLFDEWLARVFCYCVGEAPTAFIKQNNRATAQQGDDSREESGEAPLMAYLVDQMNKMLQQPIYFGMDDIEFAWTEQADPNALEQAQIDQINITIHTRTPNELRIRDGYAPIDGGDEFVAPPTPGGDPDDDESDPDKPEGDGNTDDAAAEQDGSRKVAKVKKNFKFSPREVENSAHEKTFEAALKSFLPEAAKDIAEQVTKLNKATNPDTFQTDTQADAIADALDFAAWTVLVEPAVDAIGDTGTEAVAWAFAQLSVGIDDSTLFQSVNQQALAYAKERSAEMVGMKYINGELVPNPDAEWQITETTREQIRELLAQSFEDGVGPDELAEQIANLGAFDESRAALIARTEVGNAHMAAAYNSAAANGAVTKEVLVSSLTPCDDCEDYGDLGEVPMDYEYDDGVIGPKFHPSCRCGLATYTENA